MVKSKIDELIFEIEKLATKSNNFSLMVGVGGLPLYNWMNYQ